MALKQALLGLLMVGHELTLAGNPWEMLPACALGLLDVCNCRLGAKGLTEVIEQLATCETLHTLRISRNVSASESHRAQERLGEALVRLVESDSVALRELELQGDFTPKSGSLGLRQHLLPMLEALQNNTAMTALDIDGNDVGI